jgi:putative oxidoreductase
MKKIVLFVTTWIVALQFIIFGLNKFIWFVSPPPPTDPTALSFIGAMFGSYLAKFVGFFEIIGSILLLIKRTEFIGLLVLVPIMLNIVVFHLAHDNPGNGIWIIVTVLFAIVCYPQINNFKALLKINNK